MSSRLTAIVMLASAAPAFAVTPAQAGLQAMRELNLIVLDNLATGHDVEGKTFVGGNVTGNSATFGIGNGSQGATPSGRRTLTVGGSIGPTVNINNGSNGGSGNVATTPGVLVGGNFAGGNFNATGAAIDVGGNFGGNFNIGAGQTANIGGSVTGSINGTAGATVRAGGSINGNANGATFLPNQGIGWNAATTSQAVVAERTALATNLSALSSTLAGLSITGNPSIVTFGGQGPIFNANAGTAGYALFAVAGSVFTNPEMNFTLTGSGAFPIIVNVSGTSINWTVNPVGAYNAALNQRIIWNFHEATSITFGKMVHGSVLAPLAAISNITPIEGSVAVRAFNQGGEVHLGTFGVDAPFLAPPPGPPPIPEPATWAMLIAGFGLVGGILRQRRMMHA